MHALAKKERVPARIARGELEGKMKSYIWRKLHPEKAKRFDEVYALLARHPELDVPDAFGAIQGGMSPEEFLARKAKGAQKAAVKSARSEVSGSEVDAFIQALISSKEEVATVLAERTLLDALEKVGPAAFTLARHGRLEKLQVVGLSRRASWEKLSPLLVRDSRLAQRPAPIIREPQKRPVSDPRPFLALVGGRLEVLLRNGMQLALPLRAVGPFDLLFGESGDELFVPLHAVLKYQGAK